MTRRRRWWIVGAAAIALVGAAVLIATWTAEPERPLHFWVRSGVNPPRIYASAGRAEISNWTAEWARSGRGNITLVPRIGFVGRARAWMGLPVVSQGLVFAKPIVRHDGYGEWLECVAHGGSWPDGAEIDPDLVGDWAPADGSDVRGKLTLLADGRVGDVDVSGAAGESWARLGDVVLIGRNDGVVGTFSWCVVVDSGGQSLRTPRGDILRRTR